MTEKFEAETKVEFEVSHRESSEGFFAWGQIKNGKRTVQLRDRTLDRNKDWVITFDEARQLGALIDAAIRGAEVEHGKWIRREIAALVVSQYQFSEVAGIPRGGTKLAERLIPHINNTSDTVLIVDDVLTTGTSMIEVRKKLGFSEYTHHHIDDPDHKSTRTCLGFAVFQRGETGLWWVESLFKLNDDFAPVYASKSFTIPETAVWEIEYECLCGRSSNYTGLFIKGQIISPCPTCFSSPKIYEMIRHKQWVG